MRIEHWGKRISTLFSFEEHRHRVWELIYVWQGELTVTVGDTVHLLKQGDVIVVPPNTPHSGISNTGFKDLYLGVDSLPFQTFHHYTDNGDIQQLLDMAIRHLLENDVNRDTVVHSLLECTCHLIRTRRVHRHRHAFVEQLMNVLYHNIGNCDFSLAEHTAAFGYHPKYVSDCFRKEVGVSPTAYLMQLRMEQAKTLLTGDDYTDVQTVATQCGFANSLYFSSYFKSCNGLSPSQYRKIHKL